MQRRKIMGCGESWKKLTIFACQRLNFWKCLCTYFSDINCIIYETIVDFGLILAILIFLFAVPKLAFTKILNTSDICFTCITRILQHFEI